MYVEPGKQPALIRDLALEAVDYMDAHDLVTVPQLCRESWRMAMMSPETAARESVFYRRRGHQRLVSDRVACRTRPS